MVNFGKLKFKFQYMFLKNFWNLPLPITMLEQNDS